MMIAARLHGVADLRLVQEPVPVAGPGMSLVRVTAVGVCGSDLHWYTEGAIGDANLDSPLVLGHEFAGVIEGGPRHGERVAIDPAIPCGRCEICREGHFNLCPQVRFAGHGGLDGALREFVAWPDELLHRLPDTLSDADGAMLEPLGVALHSVDLGHIAIGTCVAVIGAGPIGLLIAALARAAGAARVIVVEPLAHRLPAATAAGADIAVTPDEATTAFWHEHAGLGAGVTFEVAGNDHAVDIALNAARPGSRVVLVGIPDSDRTAFTASVARRKGLTIALARRMNETYPRAIGLVEQKRIDVSTLVTHQYPLARVAEAFETAQARLGGKVIVEPGS
jgi:L-iditol 2-dehydrogenase